MTGNVSRMGVLESAASVKSGRHSALELARAALDRISAYGAPVNAVTRILAERALEEAAMVDARIARGEDPGPLAGVPYGVKDLFDIEGLATTAGAARLAHARPARSDAEAIRRLKAAGAVLVATFNMDEFAYGFVTDNARWGLTRNPHDLLRFAGGSSGGSAAAVAAALVPFALGSDTNGSIRIPASLCGLYGMKPTHASLPLEGVFPFAESLDDIGTFTRSAGDLMAVDSILRGHAEEDDGELCRPAFLGGWFRSNLAPEMEAALGKLSDALASPPLVEIAEAAQARSAAFLITAYEGGNLHREALRADPLSYDPATRDRLLAGAALPASVYQKALAFRAAFDARIGRIFAEYDVLIAPAAFGPAPLIEAPFIPINGMPQSARANLGLYTQPVSLLGLPVVAAPLAIHGLPLGIQLIAAKGRDRALLRFAAHLEARGLTSGRCAIPDTLCER